MVNELRKKTSINAYLQVDGLAAFGIAAIAATMYITMIMGSSAYFGIYTLGRYISFASNN